ncbi:uncharacterized protein LOC112990888 isoform X2 [Dromaius novaehollandiae]|uniref:uncharacterized protein LOC112990888 isoform X2 n=1 Tax=Dromaius novaehollandiae TaxID=8790 RepID=UPI00311F90C5
MEREAKPCSQPADGHPSTRERSEVGHQEPPAATQRSQSSASSHQRDRLPLLPRPESSQDSEDGSTKTVRVEQRVVLPCRSLTREELPLVPCLPPLPTKAASQADVSLRTGRGQAAASTRPLKLPALPTSAGRSARSRPEELEWPAENSAADDCREDLPLDSGSPLRLSKQDASAFTGAREEHFPAMPEARPSSSTSALATPRPSQGHGSRITLPPISRQPSRHSSFLLGSQSAAEGTSRGGPASLEWDKPWPRYPVLPSRRQVPDTRVQSHNSMSSESSASQGGDTSSRVTAEEAGLTSSESPSSSSSSSLSFTEVLHGSAEDGLARPHGEMAQADSSSPSLPDFATLGHALHDLDIAGRAESPGPAPHSPTPSDASLDDVVNLLVSAALQSAVDVSRRAIRNCRTCMRLRRSSAWLHHGGCWHTRSVRHLRQAQSRTRRHHMRKAQPRCVSKDLLPMLVGASVPAFLGRGRRSGHPRQPPTARGLQQQQEQEEAAGTRVQAALEEEQGELTGEEAGQQDADRDLPEEQQLEDSASVHVIWVRPSFQSLLAGTRTHHNEEVPCSLDSEATDADRGAAGNPQCAPLPQAAATGAEAEDSPLAGGSRQEGTSTPLPTAGSPEAKPAASPSAGGLRHQVPSEHKADVNSSSSSRDMPEDDPAVAALLDPPAPRQRPSLLTTLLQALHRAFSCSCLTGQREGRGQDARARRLP